MARICCGVVGEAEASATVETCARAVAKRRRMEIRQFKLLAADMAIAPPENGRKRQKVEVFAPVSPPRGCENAVESCVVSEGQLLDGNSETKSPNGCASSSVGFEAKEVKERPRFGMTSVCGRRRDMEDAVAIHPSLCRGNHQNPDGLDFFGVYDGHGCSHVIFSI